MTGKRLSKLRQKGYITEEEYQYLKYLIEFEKSFNDGKTWVCISKKLYDSMMKAYDKEISNEVPNG